ncbi:MAG: hypothetical protein K6F84_00840 [Lachnospiraceae bacterium]|nr:hypothetical protein [Lachnospiraceae bacterium]
MKNDKKTRLLINIIALGFVLFLVGFVSLCFDHYYSLNDDVLIKDILSGVYSGKPSSHTVYMSAWLGAVIAFLYRVTDKVPWYGVTMLFLQYAPVYVILRGLLYSLGSMTKKIMGILGGFILLLGVVLPELVFCQYTVTSAMLAAGGIFIILTSSYDNTTRDFLLTNIGSVVMMLFSFSVRHRMMLLMLPFYLMAVLFRFFGEKKVWTYENILQKCTVIAALFGGMTLILFINAVSYNSSSWQDYMRFNEARTGLYDYSYIPDYDDAYSLYADLELTPNDVVLLKSYNYCLSDKITKDTLKAVDSYSKEKAKAAVSTKDKLIKTIKDYVYREIHFNDYPYNALVILLYCSAYILFLISGRWRIVLRLMMLSIVRSILWVYIIYKGRYPDRITHSLYIVEFVLVMGFVILYSVRIRNDELPPIRGVFSTDIFKEKIKLDDGEQKESRGLEKARFIVRESISIIMMITVLIYSFFNIPSTVGEVKQEMIRRENINSDYRELKDFCAANPQNFYFLDVYTTVSFSEKLFGEKQYPLRPANYDLLGGWYSKSPETYKKWEHYGFSNISDALINKSGVYVISANEPAFPNADVWLGGYYVDMDKRIRVDEGTVIKTENGKRYYVYEVRDY